MKRVNENAVLITVEPNLDISLENMMAEWGGTLYAQLSVLLVYLKFLAAVHQNHHWISMGESYYGDHLLFERLYSNVSGEIDKVAEKSIGLGCVTNVNLQLVTQQVNKLVSGYGMTATIPQLSDLARRSLMAEMNFLKAVDFARSSLEECGLLTNGVDNMLQDIADAHEGNVYLLKQRCSRPAV